MRCLLCTGFVVYLVLFFCKQKMAYEMCIGDWCSDVCSSDLLGIYVDCAPCLDLPRPGAHDVIGDRAFGGDPELVAALGRSFCEGLLASGVLPTLKIGRAHV